MLPPVVAKQCRPHLLLVDSRQRPRRFVPLSSSVLQFKGVAKACFTALSGSSAKKSHPADGGAGTAAMVIVGGGPSGLTLALLLAQYGVPSHVLEQQSVDARFRHPQAHFLNTRTMELLRYWLPDVYSDVQHAMPPVHQWESFRFGSDLSQNPPLAEVRHPVRNPLLALRDANGTLVNSKGVPSPQPSKDDNTGGSGLDTPDEQRWLSPCTVGHLAQHTFGRILYERALQYPELIQLHYDTTVERVVGHSDCAIVYARPSSSSSSSRSTSHPTSAAWTLETPLCVAADGAHSSVRHQLGIAQSGAPQLLQHLINIHVTLPPDQAQALHSNDNSAMLYSVFHPEVVAMVVCHSPGEYIVQIPYFPPYQTLKHDFAKDKLRTILAAIFGSRVSYDSWTIASIHPWTMRSLVSNQYFCGRIALVGDSAHVFPPAGGFGMNTGLQDAHNLAWRLADAYHRRRDDDSQSLADASKVEQLLRAYQNDRRPVAQQNAALSARNYQRLLQVTKACYLNERHPALLVQGLDALPVPLPIRQTIFRHSFRAALASLSGLRDSSETSSWYARHVKTNLRRVLESGAGLPLLFPTHELGFTYVGNGGCGDAEAVSAQHATAATAAAATTPDRPSDTWADSPTLRVGGLVPHVTVQVDAASSAAAAVTMFARYPRLQPLGMGPTAEARNVDAATSTTTTTLLISTANLPAQLACGDDGVDLRPTATLLVVANVVEVSSIVVERVRQCLSDEYRWPVVVARILPANSESESDNDDLATTGKERTVASSSSSSSSGAPMELILRERSSAFSFWEHRRRRTGHGGDDRPYYYVLVRPDGHVERIWYEGDGDSY